MVVRDRFAEFQKKLAERSSFRKSRPVSSTSTNVVIEMDGKSVHDSFRDEIKLAKDSINEIEELIQKTRKLHLSLLNTNRPNTNISSQLDSLDSMISEKAHSIKTKLNELQNETKILKARNGSTSADKVQIRETELKTVRKLFMDLLSDHNDNQIGYQERYRELTKRQLEIMGYSESDPEFNKLLEEPDLFTQSFLTKTREAKEQLAEATARHKMIIQLEKSIQEICKLFNDMAAMVEQQGELVDKIEENIEDGRQNVKKGEKELKLAERKKREALRKKICCYSILAAIILSIVGGIIMYYKIPSKS